MGSITIREYEYGHPKNEDYAYDTFREERDMDNLGGDNKQQNSPAEIYALVRDNALVDAELAAHEYSMRCLKNGFLVGSDVAGDIAKAIHDLRRKVVA